MNDHPHSYSHSRKNELSPVDERRFMANPKSVSYLSVQVPSPQVEPFQRIPYRQNSKLHKLPSMKPVVEGDQEKQSFQHQSNPISRSSIVRNPDGSVPAPKLSNEEERLRTLYDYNILYTEPELSYDQISQIAAHICDAPMAMINIADADRLWSKSTYGKGTVQGHTASRDGAFCAHALACFDDVMEIPNALEDERFRLHPLVTGPMQVRFYAGTPIVVNGDQSMGTICVVDQKKKKLNEAQLSALKALARLVVDQLNFRKRNEDLRKAVEEREEARRLVEQSKAEIEALNRQLAKRNRELEQQLAALTNKDREKDLHLQTPAEKVISLLKSFKSKMHHSAEDIDALESVIDIIGAHQLYTLDVRDAVRKNEVLDNDTKDFLLTQFQAKEVKSTPQEQRDSEGDIHPNITEDEAPSNATGQSLSNAATNFFNEHPELMKGLQEGEWNYDVFALQEKSEGLGLSYAAYFLFQHYGLIEHFGLHQEKLIAFMHEIEQGYHSHNPYHNSTHALDVLLGVNYFLAHAPFAKHLEKQEILGILLGAAIHDFRHPGVTNSFLVNTRDDLAILHNDISVLENYHCAEAFAILKEEPFFFLHGVSLENAREIRKVAIECVLATDMARHVELLNLFQNKVSTVGVDVSKREDRLLLLRMSIKCADISNPAKIPNLYLNWTARIMEEFYRQGDQERDLGLPISAFMDRSSPNVKKCQIGFINFIVLPTYQTWISYTKLDELLTHVKQNLENWHSTPTVGEAT